MNNIEWVNDPRIIHENDWNECARVVKRKRCTIRADLSIAGVEGRFCYRHAKQYIDNYPRKEDGPETLHTNLSSLASNTANATSDLVEAVRLLVEHGLFPRYSNDIWS